MKCMINLFFLSATCSDFQVFFTCACIFPPLLSPSPPPPPPSPLTPLATPRHIDYEGVLEDLSAIDGVKHAHSLHIWSLTTNKITLSAHLVLGRCVCVCVVWSLACTLFMCAARNAYLACLCAACSAYLACLCATCSAYLACLCATCSAYLACLCAARSAYLACLCAACSAYLACLCATCSAYLACLCATCSAYLACLCALFV